MAGSKKELKAMNHLIISIENGVVKVELTQQKKVNNFILLIFSLFILFCFALPVIIIFIGLFVDLKLGITFIFTIAIFWGTGIYLSRLLLWSYGGREVFEIRKNEIKHFFDYVIFKDRIIKKKFKVLKLGYSTEANPNYVYIFEKKPKGDFNCYLGFGIDNEFIRSDILVSVKCVIKLSEELEFNA